MRGVFVVLVWMPLFSACMTEDLHTVLKRQENNEIRITELEKLCRSINEQIMNLKRIINAVDEGDCVTGILETADGYSLTFEKNGTMNLPFGNKGENGDQGESGENGNDGTNGTDGIDGTNALLIGTRRDVDDLYYWTQTLEGVTTWLQDENGNKLPVNGTKGDAGDSGDAGDEGAAAMAPVIGVNNDGFWTINNVPLKDVNGNKVSYKGPAGEKGDRGDQGVVGTANAGIFKDVEVRDDSVVFVLKKPENVRFTLPRWYPVEFELAVGGELSFGVCETKTLAFTSAYVTDVKVIVPHRWKVRVDMPGKLFFLTSPSQDEENAEREGEVAAFAFDGNGQKVSRSVKVIVH